MRAWRAPRPKVDCRLAQAFVDRNTLSHMVSDRFVATAKGAVASWHEAEREGQRQGCKNQLDDQ